MRREGTKIEGSGQSAAASVRVERSRTQGVTDERALEIEERSTVALQPAA